MTDDLMTALAWALVGHIRTLWRVRPGRQLRRRQPAGRRDSVAEV